MDKKIVMFSLALNVLLAGIVGIVAIHWRIGTKSPSPEYVEALQGIVSNVAEENKYLIQELDSCRSK